VIAEADGSLVWTFEDGHSIISDTHGYTETHTLRVKAYDAAGNVAETEPIRIYITHREEDKEEETVAALSDVLYLSDDERRRLGLAM
jgi:hypothetical protein